MVRGVERDDVFACGDEAIRARLIELAREKGVRGEGVDRRESDLAGVRSYVYALKGTPLSVSLGFRDIQRAAEPDSMKRFVEPRLVAIFEETWWAQSVVFLKTETD